MEGMGDEIAEKKEEKEGHFDEIKEKWEVRL